MIAFIKFVTYRKSLSDIKVLCRSRNWSGLYTKVEGEESVLAHILINKLTPFPH